MLFPHRISLGVVSVSALLCALNSGLCAQANPKGSNASERQKKNPALLARLREVNNYQQFAAYWTTEAGWHTELQMRNNLSNKELTVTPVLRAADGTEVALGAVTIASGDTASVDLTGALRAAPQFSGKYGSVVFRYSANVSRALYASVMIGMPGTPIMFHLDASLAPEKWVRGSREGIWWLTRDSATDYLILTNTSDHKLQAQLSLYDSAGKASQQKISLEGRQTSRLSMRTLLQSAGLQGEYGGIKVDMGNGAAYLDSAHLVYDESNGHSALMKMFDHDPQATLSERGWGKTKRTNEWITRAPMLALSNPDPALAFPAETKLEPKILVHNSTGKAYSANLILHWRSATASGTSAPFGLALKAHRTELVDVAAMQAQKVLPAEANWAYVEISAPVQPEELIAIASSYDKTGRYGAQTPFNDQLAYHWEGGKWQVDGTRNSLITAGNGGEKPVKAKMTLFYNGGKEKYEIEQTLAPDEQIWVDVGKLIRNQVPDAKGKTLPAALTSGAYQLLELDTNGTGNLFEGKLIVDKTYGHAAYGCMTCCGPAHGLMVFDPFGIPFGFTDNQQVEGVDGCMGTEVPMTGWYTTWWTGNTAIATANMWAMTGQGPGSTSDSARGTFSWGDGQMARQCPRRTDTTSGGVNVVRLSCIAAVKRGETANCSVQAPGGSTFSGWQFSDGTNTVNSNNTSSSWSGTMVRSGTVSVRVTPPNAPQEALSVNIQVNARTGFAFTAVSATKRSNPFSNAPGNCSISVPTVPAANNIVGFSCLDQFFSQVPIQVGDSGPNHGFWYVQSASNAASLPTTFNWIIAEYLDNSSSEFASKQCGNYNSSTNTGFISHAQLRSNTVEHESGVIRGHYAQYKTTQDNSSNNVGIAVEQEIGAPGITRAQFEQQVLNVAKSKGQAIATAMGVEDCNQDVRKDTACTFRGFINWPTYESCTP